MKTIAVAGTFDTKGREFAYVKSLLEELGVKAFMIHTGVFEPAFPIDVNNDEIAAAVGQDIKAIVARKDRALATETLSKGMEKLVPELYRQGKIDGIIYHKSAHDGRYYFATSLTRSVWKFFNGEIPDGCEVHHIDGNKYNDDISNLTLLTHERYLKLHSDKRRGVKTFHQPK